MKNWLTKLLAGLLVAMLLMSPVASLADEMPTVDEAAPVTGTEEASADETTPSDDTVPNDDAAPAEDAADETAAPVDDATDPADEDSDETIDDAPIFAEAFEATVSEEDAVELDEADDELNQNDALDPADDNQIEYDLDLLLFASDEELKQVFPDDAFRAWVVKKFDADESGSLTQDEFDAFATLTEISFDGYDRKAEIESLDGIGQFSALEKLDASGTGLKSFPNPTTSESGVSYTPYNIPQLTEAKFNDCPALTKVGPFAGNNMVTLEARNCATLANVECLHPLSTLDVTGSPILVSLLTENYPFIWMKAVLIFSGDVGEIHSDISVFNSDTLIIKPTPKADEDVVEIKDPYFKDPNFRAWLLDKDNPNSPDTNHDGILQATEIAHFYTLRLSTVIYNPETSEVTDTGFDINNLTGIEYFTNLVSLHCAANPISILDLSHNTKLRELFCFHTELKELNISACTQLEDLNCTGTQIRELNLKNNTKLRQLYCGWNDNLTSVDISSCPKLVKAVKEGKKTKEIDGDTTVWCYTLESEEDGYCEVETNSSLKLILEEGQKEDKKEEEKKEEKKEDTSTPATTPAATVTTPTAPAAPAVTISKTPAGIKAKAAKKGKVTVTWKKIKKTKKTKALLNQIKGIEVQYSTDPNFITDVNTKTLGKKKTKATITGLQKNTMYYVRVRYTDGAGGVSNWSAMKKVKTKKK